MREASLLGLWKGKHTHLKHHLDNNQDLPKGQTPRRKVLRGQQARLCF